MQSIRSTTATQNTTVFNGTIERHITMPDGSQVHETRSGSQIEQAYSITEYKAQIVTLEKKNHALTLEKLDRELDDQRRIGSAVNRLAQLQKNSLDQEVAQLRARLADSGLATGATPADAFLLSQMAAKLLAMFDRLDDAQRARLIKETPDTVMWDSFVRSQRDPEHAREKLDRVAEDDTYFATQFPLTNTVCSPGDVKELGMYPTKVEPAVADDPMEECQSSELVDFETLPSSVDDVPKSQWDTQLMEKAILHHQLQPQMHVERTAHIRYGPPKLIKITDREKHTLTSVMNEDGGRITTIQTFGGCAVSSAIPWISPTTRQRQFG